MFLKGGRRFLNMPDTGVSMKKGGAIADTAPHLRALQDTHKTLRKIT
jgi:hypothetical protein